MPYCAKHFLLIFFFNSHSNPLNKGVGYQFCRRNTCSLGKVRGLPKFPQQASRRDGR